MSLSLWRISHLVPRRLRFSPISNNIFFFPRFESWRATSVSPSRGIDERCSSSSALHETTFSSVCRRYEPLKPGNGVKAAGSSLGRKQPRRINQAENSNSRRSLFLRQASPLPPSPAPRTVRFLFSRSFQWHRERVVKNLRRKNERRGR